ncbi:phospholipid-transporting ATPase IF isoform X2 [Ptiloglossa arizonensis]|uniref:phospholipid-transporting ATPase IF isoform X2 n=1 Tax=Ptiloglossa arizonensis TaxID=3350558 RepID=UPI003F9F082C
MKRYIKEKADLGKKKRFFLRSSKIIILMGTPTFAHTDHRIINIGSKNDPSNTIYSSNRIMSKKYTMWNFVPRNLFEQFRRIANMYFLITALIALMIQSSISPWTSALPLSFVTFVTAFKQGYEDYLRYLADKQVNHAMVTVIRNKCVQKIQCQQIVVGDLVKVYQNEDIPCDLLLLYSTEDADRCYVTTSNLDGETNLKMVSNLSAVEVASMEAIITCQHPSSNLYDFHGMLEMNNGGGQETSRHLTIDNLLLRGSRLKDTDYILGCAIYTGLDTKLSLNSKIRNNKFSITEKSINTYIVVFMILLLVEVTQSCMIKIIVDATAHWKWYIGPAEEITVYSLITDFLKFMILYNYLVPISLYVTIELQKFLSSFFFSWDIDMYDASTDQPALTNTSDLNEELGQIEYLFVDKTGTLTENLMVFKRCSIDGIMYMEKDCDGNLYRLPPNGNELEAEKLTTWEPNLWHLMISIALCHTVQITPPSQRPTVVARRAEYRESFRLKKVLHVNSSLLMDPALPDYQATSADEKALVEASARCGVVFHSTSSDTIELMVNGEIMTFKKLEVLEFTSERKRMSIIVKDKAGDYWLYCKGADSTIFPLIESGMVNESITHVADFARRGYRTLVVAYKKMNKEEFQHSRRKVEEARQITGNKRGVYMKRAYDQMENGLTLLGVTAIEDRLQDGVQDTLESLRVAGIKIWVLTGDKAETAENIAFLCGQFKAGTEILRILDVTTEQFCLERVMEFQQRIKLEPYKQYGLLVDGTTVTIALKLCLDEFRFVGMACEAVVCCRLTPLQKSEIVSLVKRDRTRPHTAAVGDGGNDVAMIQEANVGIGIMGKEGRQATMSSDFAVAKFKFLKKALLVHGHWFYMRISTLTLYFFYKNILFITPQLLFGLHNGFSGQVRTRSSVTAFYDGMFLMLYNVIFTSLPILVFGLLEQDYSADRLLRYPYMYKIYKKNYLLSKKQFYLWTALGVWHTIIIYFMTYYCIQINPVTFYNNTPIEQWAFSTFVVHLVTLVANVQILIHSSYRTIPFILSVVLSELVFLGFSVLYSFVKIRYDGDILRVFPVILSSISCWFLAVVIVVICLIPDYLIITYNSYRPARVARRNEEQL